MAEVEFIPVEDIYVKPDRQRKLFNEEDLEALRLDILRPHGLLQPLVLEADGETLIAGERRLRCIRRLHAEGKEFYFHGKLVPRGTAPCLINRQDLDEYNLEFAQLSENLRRANLTWQEQTLAIAKLHELEKQRNPATTLKATAKKASELSGQPVSAPKMSDVIFISRNMHRKAVANAKTFTEAKTALSLELEREFQEELGRAAAREKASRHTLIQGDARDILHALPSDHFDCIITDPPYGINADQTGGFRGRDYAHGYNDSQDYAFSLYEELFNSGMRVTKPEAHLYAFCDISYFPTLRELAEAAGWWVWRWPLIWHKTSSGGWRGIAPHPYHGPTRSYEAIIYCIKGKKETNARGRIDVISTKYKSNPFHPAAKPVELYVNLLERSTVPGDTILDPFCGLGTVFLAANRLNLTAYGIELDEGYADLAKSRMGEVDERDDPEGRNE